MKDLEKAAKEYVKTHSCRLGMPDSSIHTTDKYCDFMDGANHIINSPDYLKRSDVVEAILNMMYELQDNFGCKDSIKSIKNNGAYQILTELLTKFKTK